MKNIFYRLCVIGVMLFLLAGTADAKWWIFGKAGEDVGLKYLYINDMSFDEKDAKITIYRDTLPDGMLHIRGQATAKRNKIGAVNITTDGKTSWQAATLSKDGTFIFSFKPKVNTAYDLYVEVLDTTGKNNKVDETHKLLTISDLNMMDEVKAVLDKMVEAYDNEKPMQFMTYVSPDFAGDDVVLERAIRKDFTAFDNINLRYTISTIASDPKGRIAVSILYDRSLISTKDGKSYRDKGTTQFVFEASSGTLKVWSMKVPLIFGLSDAANVATGATYIAGNTQIIIVDANGNTALKPFSEAIKIIQQDGEVSQEKSVTLRATSFNQFEGFIFADEERTSETEGNNLIGDFALLPEGPQMIVIFLHAGVTIAPMGDKKLSEITEAPDTGYMQFAQGREGSSYAIKLTNNTYGAFEIVSITGGGGGSGTVLIKYKYQPNGSLVF